MLSLKRRQTTSQGFSLVELLLVLAIIGIIAGIAIPAFMGQRKRARVIGDAESNTRAIQMQLEARKAEQGIYGSNGYVWSVKNGTPTSATFLPALNLKGATQMNYKLKVTSGGLRYTITATDPFENSATVLTATEAGSITLNATYNK